MSVTEGKSPVRKYSVSKEFTDSVRAVASNDGMGSDVKTTFYMSKSSVWSNGLYVNIACRRSRRSLSNRLKFCNFLSRHVSAPTTECDATIL